MKTLLINGLCAVSAQVDVLNIEDHIPESFPDIQGVKDDKFNLNLSEINVEDCFRTTNSNEKWGTIR